MTYNSTTISVLLCNPSNIHQYHHRSQTLNLSVSLINGFFLVEVPYNLGIPQIATVYVHTYQYHVHFTCQK